MRALERARANYPLSLHGVGLGLGSADGVDREHLARVKRAIAASNPRWCPSTPAGATRAASFSTICCRCPTPTKPCELLARQVGEAQDFLGRRLLIENVSAYVAFEHSRLHEWEFLAAVAATLGLRPAARRQQRLRERAESRARRARVHRRACRPDRVGEIHLAGHARNGAVLIDDHGSQVCDEVWELYRSPSSASARCPRSSNGTPTFRRSRPWSPRAGARIRSWERCVASLRELQGSFAAALRDPSAACRGAARRRTLRSTATTPRISFRAALESSAFPVVRRRVGDDYFRQLGAPVPRAFSFAQRRPPLDRPRLRRHSCSNICTAANTPGSPIWRGSSGRASRRRSPGRGRRSAAEVLGALRSRAARAPRFHAAAFAALRRFGFPVFSVWAANQVENAPPVDQSLA